MSVDYMAKIIYGIPYKKLFIPTDGDAYDKDAYWEAMNEFCNPESLYSDIGNAPGVIGEVVAKTEATQHIDFATVKLSYADDVIKKAYSVLTGEEPDIDPGMYLQLEVW